MQLLKCSGFERDRGARTVGFLLGFLGGVLGLVVGWVATAAAALMIGSAIGVSNAEGAYAMGAIFFMGPVGGLVGLVLGIWLVIRARRKRQPPAEA
jgi:hypothetical protein